MATPRRWLVPSRCPKGHSPSHVAFDPVWRQAEEAGLPILFHVGGEEPQNPGYFVNGLPRVKGQAGQEILTSVAYMSIPNSVTQTLACLIIDGVMDRFPRLKFGVIELGASWLPGWMRFLDSAAAAFAKNEERLQKPLRPGLSEIARRQLRVTPYPNEDTGWILRNSGEEMLMFSSDYPHPEGGRNPLKWFDNSLKGLPAEAVDRFYCENFVDLMGEGLAPDLRRPQRLIAA